MDLNSLRVIVMIIAFIMFLAIVAWAWSRKNKSSFDEAAQLPFNERAPAQGASSSDRHAAGG